MNILKIILIAILIVTIVPIIANSEEQCILGIIGYYDKTTCYWGYCYTEKVPIYGYICTEKNPIIPEVPTNTTVSPTTHETDHKPTTIGFAYTFGHNDVERYQIQKNISDMRAAYIMENIAWSYGLYPEEFERKYNIT